MQVCSRVFALDLNAQSISSRERGFCGLLAGCYWWGFFLSRISACTWEGLLWRSPGGNSPVSRARLWIPTDHRVLVSVEQAARTTESHSLYLCLFGMSVMITMFNLMLLDKWHEFTDRPLLRDQLTNCYRSTSSLGKQRELDAAFEDHNRRMVGVVRAFCGSSSPTLLPKQGSDDVEGERDGGRDGDRDHQV